MRFTLYIFFPCLWFTFYLSCTDTPKNIRKEQRIEMPSDTFEIWVDPFPKDKKFVPKITPLLSLTEEYPIIMDSSNHSKLENLQKNVEEAKRNVDLWRFKSFPWKELLALFLFASVVILVKGAKNLENFPKTEELDAEKKSLQALEGLKPLLEKQDYKEFYVQTNDVVRCFIEEKLQIKTSTKTTPEFLQEMARSSQLNFKIQILVSDFFQEAERIKFAAHLPSRNQCEEAYKSAKALIRSTSVNP
jgi:hypothetical protein